MVRTKIEINISALGQRTKTMSMIIGSNTTVANVVRKVLEKFQVQERVTKYQLMAVAKNATGSPGRVLQDTDNPSHVLGQSRTPIQFVLHSSPGHAPDSAPSTKPATSYLIRVHYQLEQGVQGFTSLIITPEMSAREVLQRAVANALPAESASNYNLILMTPKGDIPVRSDEYPHTMNYSSSHFEIRKKKTTPSPLPFQTPPTSPPSLSPTSMEMSDHTPHHESLPDLSLSQLLKGKIRLHGELIDALRELAAQSNTGELFESSSIKSRETVLEQALVEQNQILDMMQELVSTLEAENKDYRETLTSQSRQLQAVSGWEAKAKQAEREVSELRKRLLRSPGIEEGQIARLKKQLEEKNHTILGLQSRLRNESGSMESSLMAKLSSTRTKLETERVRCIELEEEIAQVKDEMTHLKRKTADSESVVISKESKILHLQHEMEILRNFEREQQDLIMKQRGSLANKDTQLSSLTRALKKEKKVADQLRRIQLNTSSSYSSIPRVGDSSSSGGSLDLDSPGLQTSLFEQVSGRQTCTIELTRITEETELGFSFTKVALPISSRIPCLIVKAVREDGMAAGLLCPGDELIEVNGTLCRSARQSRAIRTLEQGRGVIKIVVARETTPPLSKSFSHSTPIRRPDDSNDRTALWASAVSPKGTTFQSFSIESMVSTDETNSPEYVTIPELYALSVTKDSQESLSAQGDNSDSGDHLKVATAERLSSSSINETESLATGGSKEAASRRKLQGEIAELQDQLDESEQIRLNFESELDSTQEDAEQLRKEYEVTKAENQEVQQQLSAHETEMANIREHISALQTALLTLEAQLTDEQQKLSSMENLNRVISNELIVAKETTSQAVGVREGLEQEVQQLRGELELKEDQMKEMQDRLQELKMDNMRLGSDASRMGGEISELRVSLEHCKRSSEETIASLKQEHKQLSSQLEMAKTISEKSSASSQEEYQHLTSQLKSAKSILMEAEIKENQRKIEVRYLKQAADLANTQLKKLEADHHKAKEELGLFKQRAENVTLEMETVSVGLKNTQMKLEGKQELVTRLQGDVDNLRRSGSKLRNENSQLKDSVKKLELELKSSSMEEKRLEEKLDDSMREKDEMFQQLETSFEESTELSATVEMLNSQVRELEEAKEKQAEVESTEQDDIVQSLKTSEAKLQHELEVNQKRVELMTQQSTKMKEEMKILENKCEVHVKELNQARIENEQLVTSRDELHQQLTELHESHAGLKEELETLRVEVDDLKSEMMHAQEQAKIKEQHLEESKKKLSELDSDFKVATEEKKQSENMVASLEFIQTQDQAKLEQMKQAMDGKEKEIKRLNDQIEGLNSLVQKTKVEQTSLVTSATSLRQQLEESRRNRAEEAKDSKDQLAAKEKKLIHLNDEFKAQEALSEMLQSKIEHLSELLEEARKEKQALESAMTHSRKEKDALQSENSKLQSQVSSLKLEIIRLTSSTDSLSSESAGLRQQLRQNEQEVDQLTAQLHALEMNFEATSGALRESERVGAARSEEIENMQAQCKHTQLQLADLNEKLEAKSMETFENEDEITKLKAELELRQTESSQLQESLIMVQASAESSRRKISELEADRARLKSSIAQLNEANKELQDSFTKLEQAKDSELHQCASEIEKYQNEIRELRLEREACEQETARLKIAEQDAKDSINQLLSDQEKMKDSIGKLGNEKDMEIIKLQDEVREMKSKLDTATGNLKTSSENKETLKREISKLEQNREELHEQLGQEARANSELKEEIQMYKTTESEITELNLKVTKLSETLKAKTLKLSEAESARLATESELQNVKSENETLLEKALELSDIKISMEQMSNDRDELHKELEEKAVACTQAIEERDRFLARVREFEVHNHAMKNDAESNPVAVVEPAAADTRDTTELLQALHNKEEEMSRTREYTNKLLINVMMNASFLLEKL